MIPGQSLDAPVIGGLRFLGEETARNTLIVIPVMGHTGTALAVPGTVVSTGTWAVIVTARFHFSSLLEMDLVPNGT